MNARTLDFVQETWVPSLPVSYWDQVLVSILSYLQISEACLGERTAENQDFLTKLNSRFLNIFRLILCYISPGPGVSCNLAEEFMNKVRLNTLLKIFCPPVQRHSSTDICHYFTQARFFENKTYTSDFCPLSPIVAPDIPLSIILISSKRLFFKNMPHDWSFQHCTWLYLTVSGCTWLCHDLPFHRILGLLRTPNFTQESGIFGRISEKNIGRWGLCWVYSKSVGYQDQRPRKLFPTNGTVCCNKQQR